MTTIKIKNFSCIKDAELDIKKINVIIGPQGSGKSVVTKLIYFFNDLIPSIISSSEDGVSLNDFKKNIEKNFSIWFSPSAWGVQRFLITYSNDNFSARIMRRKISGALSEEVSIKLSPWVENIYLTALKAFEDSAPSEDEGISDDGFSIGSTIEISSRIRSIIWDKIESNSDGNIVRSQTFIPAGRAFFTSIGRLVAGIENSGSLDPATMKFARLFANWRDASGYQLRITRTPEYQAGRREVMRDFFGGIVQSKRDSEYIEMDDGRKVPFSSLSSGQQELLPIWYFLDNIMMFDERRRVRSRGLKPFGELILIEEPEAHLFPKAQCALLDTLISKVSGGSAERKMIITTHSPYLMSRLNVLLKAGSLSRRKKKNKEIDDIIPRDSWIKIEDFSANKIEDGLIHSIIDDGEGLIDARFLDSISDVISEDFSKLLDLEYTL